MEEILNNASMEFQNGRLKGDMYITKRSGVLFCEHLFFLSVGLEANTMGIIGRFEE